MEKITRSKLIKQGYKWICKIWTSFEKDTSNKKGWKYPNLIYNIYYLPSSKQILVALIDEEFSNVTYMFKLFETNSLINACEHIGFDLENNQNIINKNKLLHLSFDFQYLENYPDHLIYYLSQKDIENFTIEIKTTYSETLSTIYSDSISNSCKLIGLQISKENINL